MEAVAEQVESGAGGHGGGRRCPFDFDDMEPIGLGYFSMVELERPAPYKLTGRMLVVRAYRCQSCGLVQLFDEITQGTAC